MLSQDRLEYIDQIFQSLQKVEEAFAEMVFTGCVFVRCGFLQCTFRRCEFSNCTFKDCNLSVVQVPDTNMNGVVFENTKAIGVDWTKAGKDGSKLSLDIALRQCVIDYSNFSGLMLKEMVIEKCIAHEVDFSETDLSGGLLTGTDFQGSTFLHTNLTGANLKGAVNYAIDPTANLVKGARFSLPEAVSLLRGFDVIVDWE